MKRRSFLQLFGASSASLLLGANATGCFGGNKQSVEELFVQKGIFEPNLFLSIDSAGKVLLALNKSEMGQGIMTASVTLVAEELEIDAESIEAVHAHKSGFGMQMTGGSTSTATIFLPIRRAAATAREMLKAAAAIQWGVPIEDCVAKNGAVHRLNSTESASYGDLVPLAAIQPIPKNPPLKDPTTFTKIGKESMRADSVEKSTGAAIFGADVDVPNKVCAYVIRPPVMGAPVLEVSKDLALKEVGVLDVVPYERGVAVLAEKFWQARRAATKVSVEWGKGVVEGLNTAEMATAARQRSQQPGDFTLKDVGNVQKILKGKEESLNRVDVQYEYPYLSHAPMEPQNCTALGEGARVRLWVPTQAPTMCAAFVQNLLGIPAENVEVNMTMLGGGFGRRSCVDFVQDAVQIARQYPGVPIQVIWSREEDMSLGYYRPQGACNMIGHVDNEGNIVSVYSNLVSQILFPDIGEQLDGLFPKFLPEKVRKKIAYAATGYLSNTGLMGFIEGGDIVTCKYDFPNFRYDFTPIHVNVPVTAWRSVAHSYSTFIMETFIDHLAVTGGQEPFEARKHLLRAHPRYLAVLESVVKHSRWGEPIEDGWGRGIAVSEFAKSVVAQVVEAGVVNDRIVVRHVTCVVDCGLVVNPDVVRAQMEGGIIYGLSMMDQKVEFVDGVVQQGNFDDFPALRMHETPIIEAIILDSDTPPTGIGEIALPPVNAAVSNAIYAATGVRLTKMPLQDAWRERAQVNENASSVSGVEG